jgi:hypothetical protein
MAASRVAKWPSRGADAMWTSPGSPLVCVRWTSGSGRPRGRSIKTGCRHRRGRAPRAWWRRGPRVGYGRQRRDRGELLGRARLTESRRLRARRPVACARRARPRRALSTRRAIAQGYALDAGTQAEGLEDVALAGARLARDDQIVVTLNKSELRELQGQAFVERGLKAHPKASRVLCSTRPLERIRRVRRVWDLWSTSAARTCSSRAE